MSHNHKVPPKFLEWILSKLYPDNNHYTSLGDFDELYNYYCEEKNKSFALLWYISQLILAIPYFIKNKFYWGTTMLKNNLKIAFRNLLKQKTYSTINIFGLAIGLSCALFIYIWVADELSYDNFHKDHETIFRVEQDYYYNNRAYHVNNTSLVIGPNFKEEIPEIDTFVRVKESGTQLITANDNSFYQNNILAVDPDFLKVFNFPLIDGDKSTALNSKSSILLSEKTAFKLFGNINPVGETVTLNNKNEFIITGIIKNPPANSIFEFEVIIPIEHFRGTPFWIENWFNNNITTYFKTATTKIDEITKKMHKRVSEITSTPPDYFLSPIKDIRLHSYFGFSSSSNMIKYIYIFSTAGIVVLIIACINFMNLSIAQSSGREKEIGLKKLVGESKKGLIFQFIGESFLTSLLALIIAFVIVNVFLESFNSITEKSFNYSLWLDPVIIAGVILITGLSAMLSGIYPALVLSSTKTITAIKGELTNRKNAAVFRRVLIISQFAISSILLASTIVIFNQLDFINKKEIGFDKSNLILLKSNRLTKDQISRIENEFKNIPGVKEITLSSRRPIQSGNNTNGFHWKGKDPELNFTANFSFVSSNFFEAMNINLIEGRSFIDKFPADIYSSRNDTTANFIINKTLADQIGKDNVLGLEFKLWDTKGKIVGVTENFNFETLDNKIEPIIFLLAPNTRGNILIRGESSNLFSLTDALEKKWETIVPDYPFDPKFYDKEIARLYKDENRVANLSVIFSSLAIFIALLGLLGMITYSAEKKRKEIGIRKVVGASDRNIVVLLSKEFLYLIIAANILAIPAINYFMKLWLNNFEYKIEIGSIVYIYSLLILILLSMFTLLLQSIKASRQNPVENLRSE